MSGGVGERGGHLIHRGSRLVDEQSEEMRESRRKGCVCSDCLCAEPSFFIPAARCIRMELQNENAPRSALVRLVLPHELATQ